MSMAKWSTAFSLISALLSNAEAAALFLPEAQRVAGVPGCGLLFGGEVLQQGPERRGQLAC